VNDRLWWAGVGLSCAAIALAWIEQSTRREHAPIAWLLSAELVADLLRRALAAVALGAGPPGGQPYTGGLRVLFHVDQGLFLVWPVGLAAAALVVLAKARARWALGGGVLAVAILTAGYPTIRRELLARAYLGIELASLGCVVASGALWWRRHERPSLTSGSVLVLSCIEAGTLIAYRQPWAEGWTAAAVIYLVGFGALVALHVGERWWRPSPIYRSR